MGDAPKCVKARRPGTGGMERPCARRREQDRQQQQDPRPCEGAGQGHWRPGEFSVRAAIPTPQTTTHPDEAGHEAELGASTRGGRAEAPSLDSTMEKENVRVTDGPGVCRAAERPASREWLDSFHGAEWPALPLPADTEYRADLHQRVEKLRAFLAGHLPTDDENGREAVEEGGEGRVCVYASPPRHFRARCRFALNRDDDGQLVSLSIYPVKSACSHTRACERARASEREREREREKALMCLRCAALLLVERR